MASLKKGKKAKNPGAFNYQNAWRLEEDEVNLPVIQGGPKKKEQI